MGLMSINLYAHRENVYMVRNVTVKELDECLTQLNKILSKLTDRIEALEEAAKAKPVSTRKTATKKDD
jgi:prefoldin subunit 5